MSKPHVVPPTAELSPDARRRYLADAARRELDALHVALDQRLAALEHGLAHPDPDTSLEELVLDLARVATAEAEAAAGRASLEAQLYAEDRAAVAEAEARRLLAAERAIAEALRLELEQARTALGAERDAGAKVRKALADARTAVEAERAAVVARDRTVEQARAALLTSQNAVAARGAELEEAERALQSERANSAQLRDAKTTPGQSRRPGGTPPRRGRPG